MGTPAVYEDATRLEKVMVQHEKQLHELEQLGGASYESRVKEMREKIEKILKDHFKLEFLNRIDEVVIFKSLTKEVLSKIVELEISKLEKRLSNKNISLKILNKVKTMLTDKGYDPTFGARPLKRVIQNVILDEIALDIIEGKIKDGDKVTIDLGIKDDILIKVR